MCVNGNGKAFFGWESQNCAQIPELNCFVLYMSFLDMNCSNTRLIDQNVMDMSFSYFELENFI